MHVSRTLVPLAGTAVLLGALALAGCGGGGAGDSSPGPGPGLPTAKATAGQVAHGRALFTTMGCADCHSQGVNDPSLPTWMAGYVTGGHNGVFQIGPFLVHAANLTPDAVTGLGGATDRQVFNALSWGLVPETPEAVITSNVPGQGNFPAQPHYLAPPMPWPSIRHLSDDDRWSLVAYIKHGVRAVTNVVPANDGPPDFWAGSYTAAKVGPYPLPPYPTAAEQFTP